LAKNVKDALLKMSNMFDRRVN